jgi:hypothetical protein
MKILTICIPTYKRFSILNTELARLLEGNLQSSCDILIVNDSSERNIVEDSNLNMAGDSLRVIENGQNLGYAQSYLTLLQNVRTKYGLVIADDDELNLDNLGMLIDFLKTSDLPLIRTQWRGVDGLSTYPKYQKVVTSRDIPHFFNHAPGIVYRKDAITTHLNFLRNQIEKTRNYWIEFYPQVVLAFLISSESELLYLPVQTGGYSQLGPQETDLKDSEGRDYSDSQVQFKVRLDMLKMLRLIAKETHLPIIRYKMFGNILFTWLKSFGLIRLNYLSSKRDDSRNFKLTVLTSDFRSLFGALVGRS